MFLTFPEAAMGRAVNAQDKKDSVYVCALKRWAYVVWSCAVCQCDGSSDWFFKPMYQSGASGWETLVLVNDRLRTHRGCGICYQNSANNTCDISIIFYQDKLLASTENVSNLAATRLRVLASGVEEGIWRLRCRAAQVFTGHHPREEKIVLRGQKPSTRVLRRGATARWVWLYWSLERAAVVTYVTPMLVCF